MIIHSILGVFMQRTLKNNNVFGLQLTFLKLYSKVRDISKQLLKDYCHCLVVILLV